jgi:glycosyltransferase involved in cell wall biosynthesis
MKISVVTPSLNQAPFIERTIESVLAQTGDFALEYLVVDGGSTDGTLDILERYRGRLAFTAEKDDGQSDALNRGLARTTGDVLCWLNSDDTYLPGALARVAEAFQPAGRWWCFGQCRIVDVNDREIRRFVTAYKNRACRSYTLTRFLQDNFISQPAVFFSRELWNEAGPLDRSLWYSMDYDLWLRFARVSEPRFIPADLANFRWHGGSKSGARFRDGSWEAFQTACRHATLAERNAIVRHFFRYLARVAVYGGLDAFRRARR